MRYQLVIFKTGKHYKIVRKIGITIFFVACSINCFSQHGIYVYRPEASIHNILHGHFKNTGAILIFNNSKEGEWYSWTGGQELWDIKVTYSVISDTLRLYLKGEQILPANAEDILIIQPKCLVSLTMQPLIYKKKKRIPKKALDLFALKASDYKYLFGESHAG